MKIELIKWDFSMEEDLIRICNAADRTFLSERLPDPYTSDAAKWWLGMVADHDGVDGLFRAILVDGVVAGNITIEQKADVYRKDGDIGYLLSPEFEGMGIMTEATRQICELAFKELDIVRITGLVYGGNHASKKVLLKNGFVLEGQQKKAVYKNGSFSDLCLYGKLK